MDTPNFKLKKLQWCRNVCRKDKGEKESVKAWSGQEHVDCSNTRSHTVYREKSSVSINKIVKMLERYEVIPYTERSEEVV